jgi:stage V sporulation protein D (sporulation-specific penicillin-binding protein)
VQSCNVSFIRMGQGLGENMWYKYLQAFGMTEPTGIDLPGEPSQTSLDKNILDEEEMGPVELASVSFGQSNSYTAVQMITAVSAAVNGGNLMQPYIVDRILDSDGNIVKQNIPEVKRQVVSEAVSAQICDMLEEMVSETTNGTYAYLAGFRVGGKSGTGEKLQVMDSENRDDAYVSSFFGFAPADEPKVAVLMALDEPEDNSGKANYFGGRLVGPSVGAVIKDSMEVLGVQPNYANDIERARSMLSVPGVIGNTVSEATAALAAKELSIRVIGDGNEVVGQIPAAYTDISFRGEVVVYTDASLTMEMAVRPNVVGLTEEAATNALRQLGLNVHAEGAPAGSSVRVETQSNAEGESLPVGTLVNIVMVDNTAAVHE